MRIPDLPSPSLLIDANLVQQNIREMIRVAGSPDRLRPHCKTHKMKEIILLELEQGIRKHKCATLAEAEMLAECGVPDILLAYNVVGPNIERVVRLLEHWPEVRFACLADHAQPLAELSLAISRAGKTVEVLLDLDVGMQRTGIAIGSAAVELYAQIGALPGIRAGGLHAYDGHNHASDLAERQHISHEVWHAVAGLRQQIAARGLPVPRLVMGGTPSFACFAAMPDPAIELSPGTLVLHDVGYGSRYPDLHFQPAAKVMTRVVSLPAPHRLTLDVGHKAIAADPPASSRMTFTDLPDAVLIKHNEEHLVIETSSAARFQPGDILFAWPTHICPTCALHKEAYVVEGENVVATWQVASRNRV